MQIVDTDTSFVQYSEQPMCVARNHIILIIVAEAVEDITAHKDRCMQGKPSITDFLIRTSAANPITYDPIGVFEANEKTVCIEEVTSRFFKNLGHFGHHIIAKINIVGVQPSHNITSGTTNAFIQGFITSAVFLTNKRSYAW